VTWWHGQHLTSASSRPACARLLVASVAAPAAHAHDVRDRWLAGLRAVEDHGVPPPAQSAGHARAGLQAPPARASRPGQPPDMASRYTSRGRAQASPSLPRRVHVPLQPAPHTDGGFPDAAGSWKPAGTDHLQAVVWGGANRISTTRVFAGAEQISRHGDGTLRFSDVSGRRARLPVAEKFADDIRSTSDCARVSRKPPPPMPTPARSPR